MVSPGVQSSVAKSGSPASPFARRSFLRSRRAVALSRIAWRTESRFARESTLRFAAISESVVLAKMRGSESVPFTLA